MARKMNNRTEDNSIWSGAENGIFTIETNTTAARKIPFKLLSCLMIFNV